MEKVTYNPDNLLSFEREWGVHRKCREWWYATGVLFDQDKNMYSYQYTLLHMNFGIITAKISMIALTDYTNNRHYYLQCLANRKNKIKITDKEASIGSIASAVKDDKGISICLNHKSFSLNLFANYGKGAFWHCDNGKLQMGIEGKRQTTLYYSYTNMPTEGTLTLDGKEIHLSGKTWFDKQGGTYNIINPKTQWEWFSLRFFDDEEIMLFTFPQDGYYDGTYITKEGKSERLNNYRIKNTGTIWYSGYKWSSGWEVQLPVKEKHYTIEPIQHGHMNLAYFEELCYVKNPNGEVVGYCFAELLPGVLNNKHTKQDDNRPTEKANNIFNLFKRIEY